jgi:hypothetical protein
MHMYDDSYNNTFLINLIVILSLLIMFTLFLFVILPPLYIDFSWFTLRPTRFLVL